MAGPTPHFFYGDNNHSRVLDTHRLVAEQVDMNTSLDFFLRVNGYKRQEKSAQQVYMNTSLDMFLRVSGYKRKEQVDMNTSLDKLLLNFDKLT